MAIAIAEPWGRGRGGYGRRGGYGGRGGYGWGRKRRSAEEIAAIESDDFAIEPAFAEDGTLLETHLNNGVSKRSAEPWGRWGGRGGYGRGRGGYGRGRGWGK